MISDVEHHQSEWPSSNSLKTNKKNDEEGLEKGEPSYTIGGNLKWYNHYGEQYGGSLKNKISIYHMIQQSQSFVYVHKKT